MTFSEGASIAGLVTGLVSLAVTIYTLGWKLGRLQLKVDTMWDFQYRRGVNEAIRTSLAVKNSPIINTDKANTLIAPFQDRFRKFYNLRCKKLKDRDAIVVLEREFGDLIAEKICQPLGLTEGACLVIVLNACKGV